MAVLHCPLVADRLSNNNTRPLEVLLLRRAHTHVAVVVVGLFHVNMTFERSSAARCYLLT